MNEWEIQYIAAEATTMTGKERQSSIIFYFVSFYVFFAIVHEMMTNECMTNAHTNVLSLLSSLLPSFPPVVAQSYKIDVEILAAPRGSYEN